MKRLVATCLALTLALGAGHGFAVSPNKKLPRIGYFVLSPMLDQPSAERAAFIQGLREHGYEDGKNVLIEYYSADGDTEKLPFRAEQMVQTRVDVIVCAGVRVTRAAQEATSTIPIVMMFTADPVATGLVKSLAAPGGNTTGMSMVNLEMGAKRLEMLKETLPKITRVAVLWDSSNPALAPEWWALQIEAKRLGINLLPMDVAGEENFAPAFERIRAAKPEALITLVDLRTAAYRDIIPEFALKQHLPTMFGLKAFVDSGGLMSYAPDFADLSRRSASYVIKILNGAKPSDLPVEQPTEMQFTINLKTARALGITIPESILLRADQIIE